MTKTKYRAGGSQNSLQELVNTLELKLRKKTEDLTMARQRLSRAKHNIQRLKGIVAYQRGRIIDLYEPSVVHSKDSREA